MRIFGLGDMRTETGRMAGISIIHSLITRILFLIIEFIFQEPHKSSLVRQNKLILTGENLRIVLRQGHLHYSIVLLLAEQNSNGGILGRQFHLAVIVVHIHLHLPQILMCNAAEIEVDEDKTLEQAIEKYQIHIKVLFIKGQALLPTYEGIAFSQLQERML